MNSPMLKKSLLALCILSLSTLSYAQFITSQASGSITSTGATITWTTPVAGTSVVNFGLNTGYGSQTFDLTSVTSHSIALTGLTSGLVYNYQVQTQDSVGNIVTGINGTFTTSGVAPSITTQPVAAETCVGTPATFTAAATGTPTPTVQWQKSTASGGSTYANISGATSLTLSYTPVATDNGFNFRAVFTNATSSVNSTGVALTVDSSPVITAQPLGTVTAIAGASPTFTSTATSTPGSPTIQWQTDTGTNGGVWTNVPSATSTTLTLTAVTLAQNGYQYRAVFTNGVCPVVISNPGTLTVTSSKVYNISSSTSSARTSGTFLQGKTLSGNNYIFTSLQSNQATFNIAGVARVCFWLDNTAMTGTATSCAPVSPFDLYSGSSLPKFVQVKSTTPQTPTTSVAVVMTTNQVAGNMNVVVVGRSPAPNGTISTVTGVTDTRGNTYTAVNALGLGAIRQSMYYAKNIGAGANTITVTFDVAPNFPDVRVAEYSGLDTTAPLDANVGASAENQPAISANSGTAMTNFPTELLVGGGTTTGVFNGPGVGFTSRIITAPDGDILEDMIVSTQGNYSASAPVTASSWVMQLGTFKAASASVLAPLVTTTLSNGQHSLTEQVTTSLGAIEVDTATFTVSNVAHQASLSWTAGAHTNPITYSIYRATVNGGPYTRIAASINPTNYIDTAVTSGTTYYYVVAAVDQVTALQSGFSNQVTAVIP